MTTIAEAFNETAAAAYEAFPERLSRLTVLLVPSADTPVYVSPDAAADLTARTQEVKDAVVRTSERLQARIALGIAQRNYALGDTTVRMIALRDDMPGIYDENYTLQKLRIFVLDHEIGHHVVHNGSRADGLPGLTAESAADTYALLRHVQRSGADSSFLDARLLRMTGNIILMGDTDHYTVSCFTRALAFARSVDISNLSLEDTAALAATIVDDVAPKAEDLYALRDAYAPVRDACAAALGSKQQVMEAFFAQDPVAYETVCRSVLDVMRDPSGSAEIYEVGRQFLLGYPSVIDFMRKGAETDPYWKEALQFIGAAEEPLMKRKIVNKGQIYALG